LVTAASAVSLLTLGAALTAIYLSVNYAQQIQLDDALLAEAQEEASEAASQGGDKLVISNRPGPMANDVGPLTKYAAIYAPDGRVLASTPTFRGQPPPADAWSTSRNTPFDAWANGEHLRAVRVSVPDYPGTHLLLAAPCADLDGDASFLGNAMLLILGVAVVWTIALGWWIVHRLTRDHDRIIAVARRVAAGDLSARVGRGGHDREIAQLAHDIDEMIERLSHLVGSQQRFIAHAAHELRSPLTTLYGELSLALRKERDTAAYRATIEEALASTRRLKDLAEDLLALARLGAGPVELFEPVDLRVVAERAIDESAWICRPRQVNVVFDGQPVTVAGHERDLARLVRNLVENAGHHARREVSVCVRLDGPAASLRVSDDGEGVRDEDRERLFEPFYRGATDRSQADSGGAGLGLAIAREIARMHGGELRLLASETGAVFELRLPLWTPGTSTLAA
jgi:two-component system heavy metal sensor histidine kinase CusS